MPALIVLPALGLDYFRRGNPERGLLLSAAAVFLASVVCRSVDRAVCDAFPVGTHFVWHLLNSVVLYLSMRAFVLARAAGKKREQSL